MGNLLDAPARQRVAGIGLLAAGWLLGFAIHGSMAAATGWGDVSPVLMLLGALLCVVAGAVAWLLAPLHRRARVGALAGFLMFVSFVVGNALVVLLWVDPAHMAESGETWFSMLIELPLWLGIPTVISCGLGAVGWRLARRLGKRGIGPATSG